MLSALFKRMSSARALTASEASAGPLRTAREGDFVLTERLGEGSYGAVWLAHLKADKHTRVAVKVVAAEGIALGELECEADFMEALHSNFLVQFFSGFAVGSARVPTYWTVMEYCAGGSVKDLMRVVTLTPQVIAYILQCVVLGLIYLHDLHKLHRDIKAANILITLDGQVKLGDFGVSGQLRNTVALRHTVIGTPLWMAPEVIKQVGYNEKADIWSLGITAIEIVEGSPPLHDVHPMKAIFMIPNRPSPTLADPARFPELTDFIARCLVKEPDSRASAKDLLSMPLINGKGNEVAKPSEMARIVKAAQKDLKKLRDEAIRQEQLQKEAAEREEAARAAAGTGTGTGTGSSQMGPSGTVVVSGGGDGTVVVTEQNCGTVVVTAQDCGTVVVTDQPAGDGTVVYRQ
eukprot:m51a1_g4677 putative serine threonine-protein kinase 4 (405) ;mRNA; r:138304-139986